MVVFHLTSLFKTWLKIFNFSFTHYIYSLNILPRLLHNMKFDILLRNYNMFYIIRNHIYKRGIKTDFIYEIFDLLRIQKRSEKFDLTTFPSKVVFCSKSTPSLSIKRKFILDSLYHMVPWYKFLNLVIHRFITFPFAFQKHLFYTTESLGLPSITSYYSGYYFVLGVKPISR